jgi:hypothetical protein
VFALVCFASNSLLCRAALRFQNIDAASFCLIHVVSGALMLGLLLLRRGQNRNSTRNHGSWISFSFFFGVGMAIKHEKGIKIIPVFLM